MCSLISPSGGRTRWPLLVVLISLNINGKRAREDSQECIDYLKSQFRSEDLDEFLGSQFHAPDHGDPFNHIDIDCKMSSNPSVTPLDLHARLAKACAYIDQKVKLPHTMELTEEVDGLISRVLC